MGCIAVSAGSGRRECRTRRRLVGLGQAIGPDTVRELHDRIVELARQRGVIRGRKMRVDTTGGGEQYPLSDRQRLVGRWGAGADADDEKDRGGRWAD